MLRQSLTAGAAALLRATPAAAEATAASHGALTGALEAIGTSRGVSTLAVKQRMKSVANIQKITKAMKMVAASKMRSAQANTENSRGIVTPLVRLLGDLPAAEGAKNVYVPVTSDKGLCGGINSTVCKYTRATVKAVNDGAPSEEPSQTLLVVMGEKGRSQLQRDMRDSIYATVADTNKVRVTFPEASAIAEELLKTEFDSARIIYNRFVSAISQKPTIATVLSPDALERTAEAGASIDQYEIEGPDRAELLMDLAEFQLATVLYNSMLENNCSEQSSRMSAMENSTKNAGEMLGKVGVVGGSDAHLQPHPPGLHHDGVDRDYLWCHRPGRLTSVYDLSSSDDEGGGGAAGPSAGPSGASPPQAAPQAPSGSGGSGARDVGAQEESGGGGDAYVGTKPQREALHKRLAPLSPDMATDWQGYHACTSGGCVRDGTYYLPAAIVTAGCEALQSVKRVLEQLGLRPPLWFAEGPLRGQIVRLGFKPNGTRKRESVLPAHFYGTTMRLDLLASYGCCLAVGGGATALAG
ncbi:ATP synthase subunit mitochondrial [Micractinium conductrix]|uniref:F-ATPase gamma subunit n=1 Tax=Micractinium conductrix TaxID=554055 RepID=A0A2P6V951_9CHLO|nr:ATP synthase subunit mitochondrial [Micractinium conductrix]|eukprot:PSC70627.1 ATP synthase subunit mitochondrial [Micractinium conductrix]